MEAMRERLARQDGVALVTAMGLMMVISLLVVAFASTSIQLSDTSVRDQRSKRALAAAEAGLQAAVFRLNQYRTPASVPGTHCMRAGPELPVGGECVGYTEPIGNGAQYTYYVTPWLGATGTCAILPGIPASTSDRCVTVIGTVGGVSRRIQTRVNEEQTFAGFLNAGLAGKALVYAYNSVKMWTDVASNQEVYFWNSNEVMSANGYSGRLELGTGATYTPVNSNTVNGGTVTNQPHFDVPPANFELVDGDRAGFTENNNGLLTTNPPYNSSQKSFTLSSGQQYTLNPGTYYFCSVHLNSSSKLRLSHNQGSTPTRIYVDHPSRPGSNCPTGTSGTFTTDDSVEINKEVGEREDLFEVYMYGTPDDGTRSPYSWCTTLASPSLPEECRSDFMLDSSVVFYGMIYAPTTTVQAHNSVKMWGGIAANKIRLYNSVEFTTTTEARTLPARKPGPAMRKGWTECRAQPTTPSDPESGC
jgi:Tfp pilus assembly protein PilX